MHTNEEDDVRVVDNPKHIFSFTLKLHLSSFISYFLFVNEITLSIYITVFWLDIY